MTLVCSCDVLGRKAVVAYLTLHGPVLTEKHAKAVRSILHKQVRLQRARYGLDPKKLCGACADNLLTMILEESERMYPQSQKLAA